MALLSPSAVRVISQRHGVVTSRQLISFGLSDTQIGHLVDTGQLFRERHSVFRHAAAPGTHDQRLALACAASLWVAISHQSAGKMSGLRRLGRDRRIHATIPGRSHIRIPGVVIHRSHLILAADIVERDDGIRVTSIERTIFDLATGIPRVAACLMRTRRRVIMGGLASRIWAIAVEAMPNVDPARPRRCDRDPGHVRRIWTRRPRR